MCRWLIILSLVTATILIPSCGDDEAGPSGPGGNPEASTLTATSGSTNAINLVWSRCSSGDFAEYSVYRSLTAGIQADPAGAMVLQIVTDPSDTTLSDSGLDWNTVYYYAIQTKDTENLTSWSNEATATTPDSGSSGVLTCYEVQGQQAGSPYESQVVTVTGIVVAGSDEYYSSTSPYAVIADVGGGAWSGLLLYGDNINGVVRGDSILITGEVQEYYGMTELGYLENLSIEKTGVQLPSAVSITTAQANEEQYESVLVSVQDAIVGSSSTNSYLIDDGSGSCYAGTRGDYTLPMQGDTVDMTGTLWYEYDEWRIQPRDDNDVTINGGGGGSALTCYEVQGQQPDSPYQGQTVSVTGIVTSGAGEYEFTYAAMADAGGGPWSGLMLYGNDVTGISRGDSITITGQIDEYFGLTELKYPTSIVVHSTGHPQPAAEVLTTNEVYQSSTAEQWESVLVRVENVTVATEPNEYGEWNVDDGSGEAVVDDLGTYSYNPVIGNLLDSVTGVLNYSFSEYKIEPRDDADIVE